MIARLYDALHDEKRKSRCCCRPTPATAASPTPSSGRPRSIGRSGRRSRRDRRMGAPHLRLGRPRARLQGLVPRHARRQRRVLCALSGERAALVSLQPGARAVHQPRHHPSAGRSRPAAERGRRRLRPRRERRPTPGLIVSGAKVVATGSVLTNYTFVAHHGLIPVQDKNFARSSCCRPTRPA